MGTSIIDLQRAAVLNAIQQTSGDDWKVLVLDADSRGLVFNAASLDDVLNCNITNVEQLEDRRASQPDTDAIYLLSPRPHIVEALKADLSRRRYRRAYLIWTTPLPKGLHDDLFQPEARARLIAESRSIDIDFLPRESNIVSFCEPWSFFALFHPSCDSLVKQHLDALTNKIVAVCLALGEYPIVKYFRQPNARHEASVLCSHLAAFVQQALDQYASAHRDSFPPPSPRPRAVLFITDRTMDLMGPLIHELTYQAMVMDLLPVQDDGLKLSYRNVIRRGQPDQEEKVVELTDSDKLWVQHRHMHMKDLLVRLSQAFKDFQAKNSQFAEADGPVSVNTIKDMIAGLPEFQEGKEAFSLHIDMAERCARLFQERKLLDITSVEQCLATGLDEENKKPRRLADQVVRLLDDDSVVHEDRLRLLITYILYRNGILAGDIEKLRNHGQLSPMDSEIIYNLDMLGARVQRQLKDESPPMQPLFPSKPVDYTGVEEISLTRFEPVLRRVLEEQCQGTLDTSIFPAVKPHLDNSNAQAASMQTSLRVAGKPTWAQTRSQPAKPQQRLIVFMAGGATYAESRVCYQVGQQYNRDIYLATTHMHTPKTFLRQVSLLSAGRKQLDMPMDNAKPQLPAWMSDPPPQAVQPSNSLPSRPKPTQNGRPPEGGPQAPTAASKLINPNKPPAPNGAADKRSRTPVNPAPVSNFRPPDSSPGKVKKEKKKHLGLFHKKDK
ncbi:hypothetical protein DV735_g5312, partial [Chaetothyriales sp. CBS 134920]